MITKKHIDIALKFISSQKIIIEKVFEWDITKKKRKLDELEYCLKLIKVLKEENENLKKQPKML